MNVLDLFSGIGGFSLGLERAGMRTVAFCEIEPYCRAVLRKHWPDVPCFSDVRDLHAFDVGPVDVICGGFPCQDISYAGKGAGLAGERSGLWSEYRRLIEECRPRYAIIENVSALRSRGLDTVLGSLAEIGYDAEWHCIPASAIGAPHRRDRVWIVAYPGGERFEQHGERDGNQAQPGLEAPRRGDAGRCGADLADSAGQGSPQRDGESGRVPEAARWLEPAGLGGVVAHAGVSGLAQRLREEVERRAVREEGHAAPEGGWWTAEPDVGRVANGVPSRVDRLRALGNAVVPQIPEIIGRAIMKAEAS